VIELHENAIPIFFDDLDCLWIHETRSEILLALQLAALRDAVRHIERALELLAGARLENSLRFYDERVRDRQEREAAQ
jgi:hypothetical protein